MSDDAEMPFFVERGEGDAWRVRHRPSLGRRPEYVTGFTGDGAEQAARDYAARSNRPPASFLRVSSIVDGFDAEDLERKIRQIRAMEDLGLGLYRCRATGSTCGRYDARRLVVARDEKEARDYFTFIAQAACPGPWSGEVEVTVEEFRP
jgi:hypothetical protein